MMRHLNPEHKPARIAAVIDLPIRKDASVRNVGDARPSSGAGLPQDAA
jgi:hypothetical protein